MLVNLSDEELRTMSTALENAIDNLDDALDFESKIDNPSGMKDMKFKKEMYEELQRRINNYLSCDEDEEEE